MEPTTAICWLCLWLIMTDCAPGEGRLRDLQHQNDSKWFKGGSLPPTCEIWWSNVYRKRRIEKQKQRTPQMSTNVSVYGRAYLQHVSTVQSIYSAPSLRFWQIFSKRSQFHLHLQTRFQLGHALHAPQIAANHHNMSHMLANVSHIPSSSFHPAP